MLNVIQHMLYNIKSMLWNTEIFYCFAIYELYYKLSFYVAHPNLLDELHQNSATRVLAARQNRNKLENV